MATGLGIHLQGRDRAARRVRAAGDRARHDRFRIVGNGTEDAGADIAGLIGSF
jgi:hypothetical protein